MDPKSEAILDYLSRAIPFADIEHASGETHSFRIHFAEQTHWIYITRERLGETNVEDVLSVMQEHRVAESLLSAHETRSLMLCSTGVFER